MDLKTAVVKIAYVSVLVGLIAWNQLGADAAIGWLSHQVTKPPPSEFGTITRDGMDWIWRIHGRP
jgi:hypothetical protein